MTLKELTEKATPLPWTVSTLMTKPQSETAACAWICPPPKDGRTQNAVAGVIGNEDSGLSDAAMITHCVNSFPRLVAALESLLPVWENGCKEPWVKEAQEALAAAKEVK